MKAMLNREILLKSEWMILLALVFTMPIAKAPVPPLIVLLCLNRILINEWTALRRAIKQTATWVFSGFYLALIAGLLHTDNMEAGLFDLEVKFSILLFPLLLPFTAGFSARKVDLLMRWFLYGCLAACAFLLIVAFRNYLQTGDTKYFFYKYFSFLQHPTYMSMFCGFSVLIIFREFLISDFLGWKTVRYVAALVFLVITVFLLASKAGIITLLICLMVGCAALVFIKKKWLLAISIVSIAAFGLGTTYIKSEFVRNRLKEAVVVLKGHNPLTNTTGRYPIWKAGLETIKHAPFIGQGTGDVRDALMITFKHDEFAAGMAHKLNAHNQYLQSAIAVGVAGGVWVLLMLLWPFVISLKRRKYFYACFIAILAVNFLFESMLETQSGVVFYAFFNSLLFYGMLNPQRQSKI